MHKSLQGIFCRVFQVWKDFLNLYGLRKFLASNFYRSRFFAVGSSHPRDILQMTLFTVLQSSKDRNDYLETLLKDDLYKEVIELGFFSQSRLINKKWWNINVIPDFRNPPRTSLTPPKSFAKSKFHFVTEFFAFIRHLALLVRLPLNSRYQFSFMDEKVFRTRPASFQLVNLKLPLQMIT